MNELTRSLPLRDRARGRWHNVLITLGVDASFLTGRNGPCPMCGGTDRWRFLNTKGEGTFICNNCGAGDGITLVRKLTGLPFYLAAQRIEAVLGTALADPTATSRSGESSWWKTVWDGAREVRTGDPVDTYLRSRCVGMDLYPECLRTTRLFHKEMRRTCPVMVARVSGPNGEPVTVHRTFLAEDGRDRMRGSNTRKFCSSPGDGYSVRLAPAGAVLGVAEGIETAMSAARLFAVPTWALLSTVGFRRFVPPPEVKTLIVFGDNDSNGEGHRAAVGLQDRLSERIRVETKFPVEPGMDWNDALRNV